MTKAYYCPECKNRVEVKDDKVVMVLCSRCQTQMIEQLKKVKKK